MTHTHNSTCVGRRRTRYPALLGAAAVAIAAACKESNVPFLTAPTSIAETQTGVAQAVTGLFGSTRIDQFQVGLELSAMSRELTNFTNTEPRFIEYDTGIIPIPVGAWIEIWAQEYQDVRSAQLILQALPNVTPAYTAQQTEGIQGVVQTLEALNYLIVAWAHDSEGFAIMESPTTTGQPLLCLPAALDTVVALLDAANANLNKAGATPFPFTLPPGFAAVGQFAGPSTAPGAFAAFNRALAAKAKLELAYAKARANSATSPTFTSPGTVDQALLTSADSAAKASALYLPISLPHNPSGGWAYDQFSVLYDFSAASGDLANPMNTVIGTQAVLSQVPADQDTVNDLRWKAKFVLNPAYNPVTNPLPVQQVSYSQAHAPNSPNVASVYIVGMYPSPSSPMPIIRSETLALDEAEIRLGLGDNAGALALVNDVRTEVGGLAAVNLSTFTDIRNQIMKEQEISTIMEGGADRLISIRMYNMAAQADTTWLHTSFGKDQHTVVFPLTAEELSGRGGQWNPSCP